MKHFSLMAATAALLLSACQNESLSDDIPSQGFLFTAATESYEGDTRTSLDADGNVLWKTGDQISIFQASTANELYQVSDASNGKTSAYLIKQGISSSGTALNTNVAYYPYDATNELTANGGDYALNVTLPATQSYAQNSFGNGAFPMAAVTTDDSDYTLKFKNVLGGLKLQLKGMDVVKSITVTGHNGEVLCGTATVTVSHTAKPSIAMTGKGATVTLDCDVSNTQLDPNYAVVVSVGGVDLNPWVATSFIVALPPMTLTGGFTVVITSDDNRIQTISTTNSQTITRSSLLVMPELTFTPTDDHAYVDLGLPSGTLWATMNVGATTPEGYGDYFAWGETEVKTYYDWNAYKWCNGSYDTLTKYFTQSGDGTADNKTELDLADDAAHANWGGNWRMPTKTQMQELIDNCTREWTTQRDVEGILLTSKNNGNQLFLPAAGYCSGSSLIVEGLSGFYLSSTLETASDMEYTLSFDSFNDLDWCSGGRSSGQSVRAVCPAN